jgi:ribonuclease HII
VPHHSPGGRTRAELPERLSRMTVEGVRRYLAGRSRVGRKTVDALLSDPRAAVRLQGGVFLARLRAEARERSRLSRLGRIEDELHAEGFARIVGVDEAGRAPFAGPVVAAAVVLPHGCRIRDLDDSKKLDEPTRERLFDEVRERALEWSIGVASPAAIDALNIYRASVEAMRLALDGLEGGAPRADVHPAQDGADEQPEAGDDAVDDERIARSGTGADPAPGSNGSTIVLVDGRRIRNFAYLHRALVDGDARCRSIAAASVVAKVARDRLMRALDEDYPHYRFRSNKGYGTSDHLEGIRAHGLCAYHRRTFAPVWDLGETGTPEFRVWQEEILRCEEAQRLHEIGEELRALESSLLPQEFRTLARLLRVAESRFAA